MSYIALYRRFRPQLFDDVVGQEHIVRTLKNQLATGRIAHAYLFAGPRGTGKTSTAKLFARAINCSCPENGNPCGTCPSCLASHADDNMDVIEIDAASNNGVDNIRDLRSKVMFLPSLGKYKVYIIDEVHMLSAGAFNALLKTLEEPPEHVVFILATTEIHKLPATILSRCQRFDFKLLPTKTIIARLKNVLAQCNAVFDDGAIALIAKSAEGGMRDALSLADVCLSYCGSNVSFNDALNVLGLSDRSFVFDFSQALISTDTSNALALCRSLEADGKDIGVFIRELIANLRDLLVYKFSPQSDEISALPEDIRLRLAEQSTSADVQRLLRACEILSSLESTLKLHNRPAIQLEIAVLRICTPQIESDISSVEDRLSVIEKKLENGFIQADAKVPEPQTAVDTAPWDNKPVADTASTASTLPEQKKRSVEKPADAPEKKQTATKVGNELWEALLDRLKNSDVPLYMMIRNYSGKRDGNTFFVFIPSDETVKQALVSKKASVIQSTLEVLCDEKLIIKIAPPQNDSILQAAYDLFS